MMINFIYKSKRIPKNFNNKIYKYRIYKTIKMKVYFNKNLVRTLF